MANFPEDLDIEKALALYRTWECQVPKGKEKDALNRLPKAERKAMADVVNFIQEHQQFLHPTSPDLLPLRLMTPLSLEERHLALIKRVGIDFDRPQTAPKKQEVQEAFDQMMIRAAKKVLRQEEGSPTPSNLLIQGKEVDYFKAVLNEGPGAKPPRLPFLVRRDFFNALKQELEEARQQGGPLANEWVQESVTALMGPVSWKALVDGYADLGSTLALFRQRLGIRLEKADLSTTSIYSRIGKVASLLKNELIPRDERLSAAVSNAEEKSQPIETSGLVPTGFFKWLFHRRFGLPLPGPFKETVGMKGASLRLEVAEDYREIKDDRNRLVNYLTVDLRINPASDLKGAQEALKHFAKNVESTRLKYGELDRLYSHPLRGGFHSGLQAEVLFEHYRYLRENVAMVEALKVFLDKSKWNTPLSKTSPTDPEITIADAVKQKLPVAKILLRLKETPEVQNVLKASEPLLERALYWGEISAKKGSFEGALALTRAYIEGRTTWDRTSYDNAMAYADLAIQNAETQMQRLGVTRMLMGAFGYTMAKFRKQRLEEARQLKIEIAREVYFATKDVNSMLSSFALEAAIKTAQRVENPPGPIKGLSDLLIMHGIRVDKPIFDMIRAKQLENKPLTEVEKQHLLFIGLAFEDAKYRTIFKESQKTLNTIISALDDPKPADLKGMEGYVPLFEALTSYFENRSLHYPSEKTELDWRKAKVVALLKQISKSQRKELSEKEATQLVDRAQRDAPTLLRLFNEGLDLQSPQLVKVAGAQLLERIGGEVEKWRQLVQEGKYGSVDLDPDLVQFLEKTAALSFEEAYQKPFSLAPKLLEDISGLMEEAPEEEVSETSSDASDRSSSLEEEWLEMVAGSSPDEDPSRQNPLTSRRPFRYDNSL